MVDGHIFPMDAAVLACVIVTCKNAASADFKLGHRAADLRPELHHGWRPGGLGWRIERIGSVLIRSGMKDIGLAFVDKDNRPPQVTDIQRFIVTVENKNFTSHLSNYLKM
jgi:hypothetical protein